MTKRPRFNLTNFNIYLWLSPTNPANANIITNREKSSLCLPPLVPSYIILLPLPSALIIIRKAELKKRSRLKKPVFSTSDWKWTGFLSQLTMLPAQGQQWEHSQEKGVGKEGSRWGTGLQRIKSICASNLGPYFLTALPKSMGNKHCQRVILCTH